MLDSNNNLIFAENIQTIGGTECVRQDIKTRLSMWEGEYPYNISEGVPYLDILRSGNKNLFLSVLRSEILKDDRIANVEISIERVKDGVATITARGETKQGEAFEI